MKKLAYIFLLTLFLLFLPQPAAALESCANASISPNPVKEGITQQVTFAAQVPNQYCNNEFRFDVSPCLGFSIPLPPKLTPDANCNLRWTTNKLCTINESNPFASTTDRSVYLDLIRPWQLPKPICFVGTYNIIGDEDVYSCNITVKPTTTNNLIIGAPFIVEVENLNKSGVLVTSHGNEIQIGIDKAGAFDLIGDSNLIPSDNSSGSYKTTPLQLDKAGIYNVFLEYSFYAFNQSQCATQVEFITNDDPPEPPTTQYIGCENDYECSAGCTCEAVGIIGGKVEKACVDSNNDYCTKAAEDDQLPGANPQGSCPNKDEIDTALGCIPTNAQTFIEKFFPWAVGLAGLTAFSLIIFGAFTYMTASGNPENIQKARETIVSAVTGLLIIAFSVVLLKIIGVDILGLPGFS